MNSERIAFTTIVDEFLHMVDVKDRSTFKNGSSQGGVASDVLLLILISTLRLARDFTVMLDCWLTLLADPVCILAHRASSTISWLFHHLYYICLYPIEHRLLSTISLIRLRPIVNLLK